MVKIRLARGGVNKKPFYTIVVTDSRKSRDSGYIQRIGYFNPVAKGKEARLNLDMEKLSIWIEKGAKLTERVQTLVKEWHAPDLYQNKRDKKIERVNKKRAQKRAEKLDTNQVETQVKAEKPKEKVKAEKLKEEIKTEKPQEKVKAEKLKEEIKAEKPKKAKVAEKTKK